MLGEAKSTVQRSSILIKSLLGFWLAPLVASVSYSLCARLWCESRRTTPDYIWKLTETRLTKVGMVLIFGQPQGLTGSFKRAKSVILKSTQTKRPETILKECSDRKPSLSDGFHGSWNIYPTSNNVHRQRKIWDYSCVHADFVCNRAAPKICPEIRTMLFRTRLGNNQHSGKRWMLKSQRKNPCQHPISKNTNGIRQGGEERRGNRVSFSQFIFHVWFVSCWISFMLRNSFCNPQRPLRRTNQVSYFICCTHYWQSRAQVNKMSYYYIALNVIGQHLHMPLNCDTGLSQHESKLKGKGPLMISREGSKAVLRYVPSCSFPTQNKQGQNHRNYLQTTWDALFRFSFPN